MITFGIVILLAAAQAAAPQASMSSMRAPNIQVPAHLPVANLHPGLDGQDTMLALKNGSVFAIRTWNLESGVLHYRNAFGGHNSISTDLIDMERSSKLNADRKMATFR